MRYTVQSVCKQRLCLHFGIPNIEFSLTTIYIFMILDTINYQDTSCVHVFHFHVGRFLVIFYF